MSRKRQWTCVSVGGLLLATLGLAACGRTPSEVESNAKARAEEIVFSDARQQAKDFIGYYHSISLTPAQARIKREALEAIPAPCCDKSSIATCCCPCNLAKATWGLAHMLIAERGFDAAQTRAAAERWLHFTNESGYAGDACYRGRCSLPFDEDGCGGMDEANIS